MDHDTYGTIQCTVGSDDQANQKRLIGRVTAATMAVRTRASGTTACWSVEAATAATRCWKKCS